MPDEISGLDSFLEPENQETPTQQTSTVQSAPQEEVNLEDEFAKLLKDFIAQDSASQNTAPEPASTQAPAQQSSIDSLDSLVSAAPAPQSQENTGLDGFVDTPAETGSLDDLNGYVTTENNSGGLDGFASTSNNDGGLDSFASTETSSYESSGLDGFIDTDTGNSLDTMVSASPNEENESGLKSEEQELARAVANFKDGVTVMASSKNLKMPTTDYEESMLIPNYKPSVGKKIAQFLLSCWDIINKYDPENMKRLSPNATDEEYLSFAESLSDTYMQLAIISYVEILINLEICEVSYEQKKEAMMKNRIKRELYEEYMELQERKNMFIQKLKEKNFPIDVDKLINNYFRAAQKDADGAFDALTKNPAMFSRIEVEKLRPKFFGLIKVTPEDGVRANQKIGSYVKKLKV